MSLRSSIWLENTVVRLASHSKRAIAEDTLAMQSAAREIDLGPWGKGTYGS